MTARGGHDAGAAGSASPSSGSGGAPGSGGRGGSTSNGATSAAGSAQETAGRSSSGGTSSPDEGGIASGSSVNAAGGSTGGAGNLADSATVTPVDGGGAASSHDFFSTVSVEEASSINVSSDGDLWVNCWADDGALYAANGDGRGFGQVTSDVVVSRIDGRPGDSSDPLRGTTLASGDAVASIWSGANYNRKPTGMLCVQGELYLAVQDLRTFTYDDAPAATIVHSVDKGRTWTWDRSAPMFSNHVFTTVMFLDFGKDGEHAPQGFVYAYGLDDNWAFNSSLSPPTALYLARVPSDKLQDRTQWAFFSGLTAAGSPRWAADASLRVPVLEDTRRLFVTPLDSTLMFKNMTVLGQGGVVYVAPLRRYLYTSWTEYTFELYEAPAPWGPWTHFYTKDFGVFPWTDTKNGGYALTIPSKFVSDDGMSLWVQANAWGEGAQNYDFSLRKLLVTPYAPSVPRNQKAPDSLATTSEGAVPLTTSLHHGRADILNDGVLVGQSEDSYDGDSKTEDVWGYTFPHMVRVDEVRYTTGTQAADGGWFEELAVEVRTGKTWSPVTRAKVTPDYPTGGSVPANTTYTFSFDEITCDGVRVVGKPGGTSHFTSIAELGVYYE